IGSSSSSSLRDDCRGDLAPSEPSGSPAASSNKWGFSRLGSNVKSDANASKVRGEDSALRGKGSTP
ncbi:hypothetical protein JG687_00008431, partial [Phytophthora cactorum]